MNDDFVAETYKITSLISELGMFPACEYLADYTCNHNSHKRDASSCLLYDVVILRYNVSVLSRDERTAIAGLVQKAASDSQHCATRLQGILIYLGDDRSFANAKSAYVSERLRICYAYWWRNSSVFNSIASSAVDPRDWNQYVSAGAACGAPDFREQLNNLLVMGQWAYVPERYQACFASLEGGSRLGAMEIVRVVGRFLSDESRDSVNDMAILTEAANAWGLSIRGSLNDWARSLLCTVSARM